MLDEILTSCCPLLFAWQDLHDLCEQTAGKGINIYTHVSRQGAAVNALVATLRAHLPTSLLHPLTTSHPAYLAPTFPASCCRRTATLCSLTASPFAAALLSTPPLSVWHSQGELLPAHGYPVLREKFPHLVGNYGGAWYRQQKVRCALLRCALGAPHPPACLGQQPAAAGQGVHCAAHP